MSKKVMNRRQFIQKSAGLGLLRAPAAILLESIVRGSMQKALAEEAGISPRNLLYIQEDGGMPRWMYDLFLTPYSSAGFVPTPHIGTRYTASGGRYTNVEYATIPLRGVNVPPVWGYNVAHRNGGTRPVQDLLSNFLSIRGIHVGNDGHDGAKALQFMPLGASKSITALSADASKAPIPAIYVGKGGFQFRSSKGLSAVTFKPYDPILRQLTDPFRSQASSSFKLNKGRLALALEGATAALNQFAETQHPKTVDVSRTLASAEELIRRGFNDIDSVWSALVGKYKDIIRRTLHSSAPFAGLNDLPIGISGGRGNEYRFRQGDGGIANDADLRSIMKTNAEILYMAEHFAVAEYVMLNHLSDSLVIAPATLGLVINGGGTVAADSDAHFVGTMVVLYAFALNHLGLSACLLELIDQLKANNLFSESVIVVASEFGRKPLPDGSGSEHASIASSVTVHSGIVSGPIVLGNVKNHSGDSAFPGSWGAGAPIAGLGGEYIDLGHWSSTLATLLRVPPASARPTLVIEANGSVVPTVELARQV